MWLAIVIVAPALAVLATVLLVRGWLRLLIMIAAFLILAWPIYHWNECRRHPWGAEEPCFPEMVFAGLAGVGLVSGVIGMSAGLAIRSASRRH